MTRHPTRRRLLGAAGAAAATLAATPAGGRRAGRAQAGLPERVGVETVADGFAAPVAVEFPPAGGPAHVVDQPGQMYAVGPDGGTGDPFLDVADRVVELSGYEERGLLGLAFHPDYPDDGRVFVRYSAPPREGTPSGYSHTFVLASFEAGGDPPRADPDSERTILEIPEPQSNHNAGDLAFGPDGYLYVPVGDGGGAGDAGDGHVDDWYDGNPGGNGQDVTENLLGSVLRIDVDSEATIRGEQRAYAVPDDNPLVGREGLAEQYAWGFRNPWQLSFDGDRLLVADVGQDRYEEVNVVEAGGNYGWNVREGPDCYDAGECPENAPDEPPYDGQPLRDPVASYPHSGDGPTGDAVVGGYVARGGALPGLRGRYVFADWQADGRLFVATPTDGDGDWPVESVPVTPVDDGGPVSRVLAFGRDRAGDLYVCTTGGSGPSGESGAVRRLVPADGGGEGTTATSRGTAGSTAGSGTTATTDGDGGPTVADGQSGFGALAGLLGVGGATGYLLSRDD